MLNGLTSGVVGWTLLLMKTVLSFKQSPKRTEHNALCLHLNIVCSTTNSLFCAGADALMMCPLEEEILVNAPNAS